MSMHLGVLGTDGKIRDVSDNNGYPMQLTGRNVKDVQTLFDGVTTGIAAGSSTAFTCTGDQLKLWLIPSGTNVSITVKFQILDPNGQNASGIQATNYDNATFLADSIVLTSATPVCLLFSDMAGLQFQLTIPSGGITGTSPAVKALARQVA